MQHTIHDEQWVWVVVQNPGGNEQFLGQHDPSENISFIPMWLEKDAALPCLNRLVRDKGSTYEVQAIQYQDLDPKAAEAGFRLFLLDAAGKILSQVDPSDRTSSIPGRDG